MPEGLGLALPHVWGGFTDETWFHKCYTCDTGEKNGHGLDK